MRLGDATRRRCRVRMSISVVDGLRGPGRRGRPARAARSARGTARARSSRSAPRRGRCTGPWRTRAASCGATYIGRRGRSVGESTFASESGWGASVRGRVCGAAHVTRGTRWPGPGTPLRADPVQIRETVTRSPWPTGVRDRHEYQHAQDARHAPAGLGRARRRLALPAVGGRRLPDARGRRRPGPPWASQLHHSVGTWPLLIDDTTEVARVRARRRGWCSGRAPGRPARRRW